MKVLKNLLKEVQNKEMRTLTSAALRSNMRIQIKLTPSTIPIISTASAIRKSNQSLLKNKNS